MVFKFQTHFSTFVYKLIIGYLQLHKTLNKISSKEFLTNIVFKDQTNFISNHIFTVFLQNRTRKKHNFICL